MAHRLLIHRCTLQFLGMLALSSEFENIAVREEELPEPDAGSRGFRGQVMGSMAS